MLCASRSTRDLSASRSQATHNSLPSRDLRRGVKSFSHDLFSIHQPSSRRLAISLGTSAMAFRLGGPSSEAHVPLALCSAHEVCSKYSCRSVGTAHCVWVQHIVYGLGWWVGKLGGGCHVDVCRCLRRVHSAFASCGEPTVPSQSELRTLLDRRIHFRKRLSTINIL